MFGAHIAQCSRAVASTSSARAASLHTSAVLQAQLTLRASARARKIQRTLKASLERRAELEAEARANRPHVILGHKAGDEAKWKNSDLARILVTAEDIANSPPPSIDPKTGKVVLPKYMSYGLTEKETEAFFEVLPHLTVQGQVQNQTKGDNTEARTLVSAEVNASREVPGNNLMFARLVDLRNADAGGIAFENRRRIVAEFSEPEKPNDTGRPEVQAAIMTMEIHNMWNHLITFKKDIASRRHLRQIVHKRAKVLRYLKRVDEDRYDRVLERMGVERGAVEGELVV
ncbi:S15/NS1 RNA-binding domain-containing protein [Epithele typhae]|uniref:S15/NS1 RNA-binding domain-containing protein n=1 Tax=Epithele typhae TaxID=378194 RepID=UPI002008483C|nr:S15/NS1 RNA-binding domain-containing protein [Epithele typhae]KAH9934092.1 S15/NS1 RNA-binding domain-containing protein [Epithele typhae]